MAEVETEAETSPLLTQPATKSADIPASVSASARLSVPTDAAIHAEGETAIGRRDSGVTETTMSAAMQPAQARPPSARSRFDDEDFSMFRLLDTPQAEREVRDEKINSILAQIDGNAGESEYYFEQDIEDTAVVLDAIDLEDIKAQEAKLEAKRIQSIQDEIARVKAKEAEMLKRERGIEQQFIEEMTQGTQEVRKRRTQLKQQQDWQLQWQASAFQKAQTALREELRKQKNQVSFAYGTLLESVPVFPSGVSRAKWAEDKRRIAPRLLRIRIELLRAIKNKLLGGQYVVMVTLYDRLGGYPLRWSTLDDNSGYTYFGSTQTPVRHGGKFYNVEMSFTQAVVNPHENDIYIVCPSPVRARPQMCLMFELFAVRGGRSKDDRVVAWGAFPMSYSNFDVIQGKYKVPLLRGPTDLDIDRYAKLEERISHDIDNWLCNLYFDAQLVPLEVEYGWCGLTVKSVTYDVAKLDAAGPKTGTESAQGRAGPDGKRGEENEHFRTREAEALQKVNPMSRSASRLGEPFPNLNISGQLDKSQPPSGFPSARDSVISHSQGGDSPLPMTSPRHPNFATLAPAPAPPMAGMGSGTNMPRMASRMGSRMALLPRLGTSAALFAGRKTTVGAESRLKPFVSAEPITEEDEQHDAELEKKRKAQERAAFLRNYKFSVTNVEGDVPTKKNIEKLRFFVRVTLLLLIVVLWCRIYTHYLGQWLFLARMALIPIYQFTPTIYNCILLYPADNIEVVTEALVVALGHISNMIIFLGFGILMFCIHKYLRLELPDVISRFVLTWGVTALLDPVLILIVDAASQNTERGDQFKLYTWYLTHDGNGTPGILLTLAISMVLLPIAAFLFYSYILHVHMNGRMVDVYYRLNVDEGTSFVPHDMEISLRTLRHILSKATRWTGFHGTKRKMLMTSYVIRDHLDPAYVDETIHLSLYNVTERNNKKPESRELYRHFIRKSDGAVMEVFDAVESMGADDYRKREERQLNKNISREEKEREYREEHKAKSEEEEAKRKERLREAKQLAPGETPPAGESKADKPSDNTVKALTPASKGLHMPNMGLPSGLKKIVNSSFLSRFHIGRSNHRGSASTNAAPGASPTAAEAKRPFKPMTEPVAEERPTTTAGAPSSPGPEAKENAAQPKGSTPRDKQSQGTGSHRSSPRRPIISVDTLKPGASGGSPRRVPVQLSPRPASPATPARRGLDTVFGEQKTPTGSAKGKRKASHGTLQVPLTDRPMTQHANRSASPHKRTGSAIEARAAIWEAKRTAAQLAVAVSESQQQSQGGASEVDRIVESLRLPGVVPSPRAGSSSGSVAGRTASRTAQTLKTPLLSRGAGTSSTPERRRSTAEPLEPQATVAISVTAAPETAVPATSDDGASGTENEPLLGASRTVTSGSGKADILEINP